MNLNIERNRNKILKEILYRYIYFISFMRINTVNITKVKNQFSTTIKTSITYVFSNFKFWHVPSNKTSAARSRVFVIQKMFNDRVNYDIEGLM